MRGAQDWKDRLSRWMRRRRAPFSAQPSWQGGHTLFEVHAADSANLQAVLEAAEGIEADREDAVWRLCWTHSALPEADRLAAEIERALARRNRAQTGRPLHPDFAPLTTVDADRLLFFDIETLGLGNAGVFLVGCMRIDQGRAIVEQLLAEDYSREPALISAFADRLHSSACLVSYNGRAFDFPLLSCRASMWGIELPAPPHLDLLYESRRRWHDALPDCRLQTIEQALTGHPRIGDIPGQRIPAVYHEFVGTGDARHLGPILQHNALDLLAMARILLVCLG